MDFKLLNLENSLTAIKFLRLHLVKNIGFENSTSCFHVKVIFSPTIYKFDEMIRKVNDIKFPVVCKDTDITASFTMMVEISLIKRGTYRIIYQRTPDIEYMYDSYSDVVQIMYVSTSPIRDLMNDFFTFYITPEDDPEDTFDFEQLNELDQRFKDQINRFKGYIIIFNDSDFTYRKMKSESHGRELQYYGYTNELKERNHSMFFTELEMYAIHSICFKENDKIRYIRHVHEIFFLDIKNSFSLKDMVLSITSGKQFYKEVYFYNPDKVKNDGFPREECNLTPYSNEIAKLFGYKFVANMTSVKIKLQMGELITERINKLTGIPYVNLCNTDVWISHWNGKVLEIGPGYIRKIVEKHLNI